MRYRYQESGRIKRWPAVFVVLLVLSGLAVGGGLLGYVRMYTSNLKPVNNALHDTVVVTIPSGTTPKAISSLLKDAKLIRATWAFDRYIQSKELSDKLQAGTYKFTQAQGVPEIVDQLVNGKVAVDLFTILPGQRIDQIRDAFLKAKFSETAVEAALNPASYLDHPALVDKPATANLEGYLYPDSFQKTAETTPKTIVKASLDEMNLHLTPELRSAFAAEKLSVYHAVTLASVVEREVSSQDDRDKVAQVFLKRLSSNMPLGSDVTVLYGAIVAGQSNPSLKFDSPYNTHLHTGLPVGPISNVSKSSLQSVAHPTQSDYLYFVSGDDGITHFSKTVEEHEALTRQYCKKLCSGDN